MTSDIPFEESNLEAGALSILEAVPQPVWVCNRDGQIQFENSDAEAVSERWGAPAATHIDAVASALAVDGEPFPSKLIKQGTGFSEQGASVTLQLREVDNPPTDWSPDSADPVALELTADTAEDAGDAEETVVFTGRWIGDEEFSEKLLGRTSRFELAALGSHAGLWAWHLATDTFYYSRRFTDILGYAGEGSEESRETWFERVHEEDRAKLDASITQYLHNSEPGNPAEPFEVELRVRHADSGFRWVLFRGLGTVDDAGKVRRMAGSVTDITDRKRAEERQQYDAFHDKLTDLPNRALFLDRLAQLLEVQREYPTRKFALLYMDIDRFKKVNDSLGPSAGDELLCKVTERLQASVRETDTIARVGGDEFALLLVNVDGESAAKRVAGDIQERLDEPFSVAGREIFIAASIGVLVSHPEYTDAEEMLRDVDIAMYHAKSNDAEVAMFDSEMHASVLGESHVESSLRHAVDSEQIVSHYQPIVDLSDGSVLGLEALMRWKHPEAGWVPPGEFFPIAKETGLLVPMGQSLLKEVCRQMQAWREAGVVANDVRLSVNFSAAELTERGFVSNVERVLEQTGLPGEVLQAEITEHALVNQPDEAGRVLSGLKALGVGVAIDDFGTGYSSLNYLRQFDSDAIKIDRDFVEHLPDREDDRQIVKTILRLAESLDKRVVCEGIETGSQREMLQELGVKFGQGFFWGRPAPADDLEAMLNGRDLLEPSA